MNMKLRSFSLAFFALAFANPLCTLAQAPQTEATTPTGGTMPAAASNLTVSAQPRSLSQAIDLVVARERQFIRLLPKYSPRIETYIQQMRPDPMLGSVPINDDYFLGRLDLSRGISERSFVPDGYSGRVKATGKHDIGAFHFESLGFVQMVLIDDNGFDRRNYAFNYVGREFLGDVRCVVFDVVPYKSAGKGRFLGRIWVEDQGYNIVRFQGTYAPAPKHGYYFHFDSWRAAVRPGVWMPAYIYSEESDLRYSTLLYKRDLSFKSQTRLWGYDLRGRGAEEEFTQVVVDTNGVKDQTGSDDPTPVGSQRAWEREAEETLLNRLTKAGLLAPPSDIDKVLETVINNIEVTNNLDVEPEIRCRVLLTSPLESFTIGHTIVLSRGLVDVLPDESSLAMVLAHELAHVVLGHQLDTKYAFSDRMLFADENSYNAIHLRHSQAQETAADAKAIELLKNSPYKDKLANAGLFLRMLQDRAPGLQRLLTAHLGDSMQESDGGVRMRQLIAVAPPIQQQRIDQIAALPLGSRVKLDPWAGHISLIKAKPVPLLSAREKKPFEVTPLMPYLTRQPGMFDASAGSLQGTQTAQSAGTNSAGNQQ